MRVGNQSVGVLCLHGFEKENTSFSGEFMAEREEREEGTNDRNCPDNGMTHCLLHYYLNSIRYVWLILAISISSALSGKTYSFPIGILTVDQVSLIRLQQTMAIKMLSGEFEFT